MGREHVAARLDALLALDAESIGARATGRAAGRLAVALLAGDWRTGYVLADDARGGWTHRYLTAADHAYFFRADEIKRGWITGLLWTGDSFNAESVRRALEENIYRSAWTLARGTPRTLRDFVILEALATLFADEEPVAQTADPLAMELLRRHAETDAYPLIFALLYGDEAAREVGYEAAGIARGALVQAGRALVSPRIHPDRGPEFLLRENLSDLITGE